MKNTAAFIYKISVPLMVITSMVLSPAAQTRGRTDQGARPPSKHAVKVRVPRGYGVPQARVRRFKGRGIYADLYADEFAQGMAAYIEIYGDPPAGSVGIMVRRLTLEKKNILISKTTWGYRSIMAISPEAEPGIKRLKIEYSLNGMARTEEFSFLIKSGGFKFFPGALDLGNYSDVDYRLTSEELRFINACAAKKKKVFGKSSPDGLRESLSHPRDAHYITSPFWSKRIVMRYRKKNGRKIRFPDKLNVHKGVDLRGRSGDPVYVMAGGRVAIAERMYYEGNFVVVDHGNRIFSFYMHLGEIKVKEGAPVSAGDRIGGVGSTGLSTAPHLHVSLMIQDVYVDPLSILSLPIRD